MPRTLLTLLGVGLTLVGSGVLAVGSPAIDASVGIFVACTACAGVAFVLAGRHERVEVGSRSIPWYVFAGIGDLALAGGALAVALPDLLGAADPQIGVVVGSISVGGGIGALVLSSLGFNYVHWSDRPDCDPNR